MLFIKYVERVNGHKMQITGRTLCYIVRVPRMWSPGNGSEELLLKCKGIQWKCIF